MEAPFPLAPPAVEPIQRTRAPSKASRAGIVIPPGRVRQKMREAWKGDHEKAFRMEKNVDLFLAAAVEAVVRTALLSAGTLALENRTVARRRPYKRTRISESNLDACVAADPDLGALVTALRPGAVVAATTTTTSSVGSPASSSASSSTGPLAAPEAPIRTATALGLPSTETHRNASVRWQYMDGGWKDYDRAASEEVESCYQTYLQCPGQFDVRSVQSGHWCYTVDFPNLQQINIQHENHTRRVIRRVVD